MGDRAQACVTRYAHDVPNQCRRIKRPVGRLRSGAGLHLLHESRFSSHHVSDFHGTTTIAQSRGSGPDVAIAFS